MSCRDPQILAFGQIDQALSISLIKRKGLLDIDMATVLQAHFCKFKMTFRRSCDVHDIRLCLSQQLRHIGKVLMDVKSLGKLLCHERVPITNTDNLTAP